MATGESAATLTPMAVICAGDKASTCVTLSPSKAAAGTPEMSVFSAVICAADNTKIRSACTSCSWDAVSAPSCAMVRLPKLRIAPTAPAGKPETSSPSACNWGVVSEAIWAAVTLVSCAAVRPPSCVVLSAFRVAPASCAASRLAMALTLSDATRAPRTATSAAVRPSTCVALSAAMRSVPAPMSAPN